MVRRPEDIGLAPDPQPVLGPTGQTAVPEPVFMRAAAMRTSTFWLLSLFTLLLYPAQAGVSLHQAPFLIAPGLAPPVTAAAVTHFPLGSPVGRPCLRLGPRRLA